MEMIQTELFATLADYSYCGGNKIHLKRRSQTINKGRSREGDSSQSTRN